MAKQVKREGERRLLTAREAAELLGTTINQLAQERCDPRWGLPFVRLGRAIRYDLAELDRFIQERTVRPEADAAGG